MTQASNSCCIALFAIISIVMLLMIAEIVSYDNTLDSFKNKTCVVQEIKYPIELPIYDTYYRNSYKENTVENSINLWSKCDCGLRCYALSSCIKMFVLIENDTSTTKEYQIQKNTYEGNNEGKSECSLFTYYCPSGNTIEYGKSKLENALTIYDEYINKSIPCYHNEGRDIVYMEKHYFNTLSSFIIVLGISLFMIMLLLCYKYEVLTTISSRCKQKEEQNLSSVEEYNLSNSKIIIKSSEILV